MNLNFLCESEMAPALNDNPDSLYRVVAYYSPEVKSESLFKSRNKAVRLMEQLADQGVAVTLRQFPSS